MCNKCLLTVARRATTITSLRQPSSSTLGWSHLGLTGWRGSVSQPRMPRLSLPCCPWAPGCACTAVQAPQTLASCYKQQGAIHFAFANHLLYLLKAEPPESVQGCGHCTTTFVALLHPQAGGARSRRGKQDQEAARSHIQGPFPCRAGSGAAWAQQHAHSHPRGWPRGSGQRRCRSANVHDR